MQAPDTKPLQTLVVADRSAPAAPSPTSLALSSPAPTSSLPFMRLDVYVMTRGLVRLVCAASIADSELRDQATRAAKSVLLNLAEGLPDDRTAVRRRYFRTADGSVHELAAALDVSAAIGALEEGVARDGIARCARVRALLRGLLR